jgi:hypothetical protein
MKIDFYNTNSPINYLNKQLSDILSIDFKLKNVDNVNEISFNSSNVIDRNYCYIDKFKKYYFVESELLNNSNIKYFLKCDFLMSYKDIIKNIKCDITASSNYNSYYDYDYNSLVTIEHVTFESDKQIDKKSTIILNSIGGL